MLEKKLEYLHKRRIIYKRNPVNDIPSETYEWGWFYEEGTHEYYALFHSKSVITSYKSLFWHLSVLYYLNPELTKEQFLKLSFYITDVGNGITNYFISDSSLVSIAEKVLSRDNTRAPNNKLRKFIFKDGTGLTVTDKLKIVGSLIGRNKNATESGIYEAMLYIHSDDMKITINKLAEFLNVSKRTIYRNMTEVLKNEKHLLNNELDEKLQSKKLP